MWNRPCEQPTRVPGYEVLGTADAWRGFHHDPRPTLADLVIQGRTQEVASLYDAHGVLCDESEQAQMALEKLATRDGLTGLANRRCFDDTLDAEWQHVLRQHQTLSVLMVDVDDFRLYNDTHGHAGGDACLRRIAGTVATEMPINDLVARYGGGEFAAVLPNQSLKGAAIVAERIRCRVEALQLPNPGSARHFVTVSIGAATGGDPAQLVATADAALHRAKHMGRNRISLPRDAGSHA